jgi:hypothetical protein
MRHRNSIRAVGVDANVWDREAAPRSYHAASGHLLRLCLALNNTASGAARGLGPLAELGRARLEARGVFFFYLNQPLLKFNSASAPST